ncbi:MAG: DUF5686 family protein [Paludibacter sp.]
MKKHFKMNLKYIKLIHNKYAFKLLLIIFLFASSFAFSQETVVVGQVLNKADNTPLHQVNIYFKNSTQVVQSNEEGYFLIRTNEPYTTLLFSCVGFKQETIKLKPGQSIGIQVRMEEENTLLQEIFVIPGANPALELMKKVRLLAKENDISRRDGFGMQSTEQNLVLLSKVNQRAMSKRIFDQLREGNLSGVDSSLVVPLYMVENKYQLDGAKKKQVSRNIFSSPESGEKILEKLVGDLSSELNFYNNTVTVFGKSMISPLANVGNLYYNYYLADSTMHGGNGKQYEIHYRSRNTKNLAFDGMLWIDSATHALTGIDAELPQKANINFIHNLRIRENFVPQPSGHWTRKLEELQLNMSYDLLADSLNPKPEIFIKRSATYASDSASTLRNNFAQSSYTQESLDNKLKDLNNTPLLQTAKWIADAFFTGYIHAGKIDIGKVQNIIRTTDIEGLRLTLPFRTNEEVWKNISLGGSVGYGFKNESIKYSGLAQFKFPGSKRRVLSLNYINDYRRVDYNYNDYLFRENPLLSADVDISSSVFALRYATKNSERKEFSASFSADWNRDIESSLFVRSNQLFANNNLPLNVNGIQATTFLQQQSATFTTRFSFGERTYDDHMQRVYIANKKPIVYSILEAGQYQLGAKTGHYGKILVKMKHVANLSFAELNYIAEAGLVLGAVPYPLLEVPPGSETGGYSTYQFCMMNYGEYATDKYVNLHSELTFNGLVLNQIPLVKNLNLREICSFHMSYGGLSDSHKKLLDYPAYTYPLNKPYMEVGVGLSNILHIFTVQSVWRLTDLNHPGVSPWGLRGCLRLSF